MWKTRIDNKMPFYSTSFWFTNFCFSNTYLRSYIRMHAQSVHVWI